MKLGWVALWVIGLGIALEGVPGHGAAITATRVGNLLMGVAIGCWASRR